MRDETSQPLYSTSHYRHSFATLSQAPTSGFPHVFFVYQKRFHRLRLSSSRREDDRNYIFAWNCVALFFLNSDVWNDYSVSVMTNKWYIALMMIRYACFVLIVPSEETWRKRIQSCGSHALIMMKFSSWGDLLPSQLCLEWQNKFTQRNWSSWTWYLLTNIVSSAAEKSVELPGCSSVRASFGLAVKFILLLSDPRDFFSTPKAMSHNVFFCLTIILKHLAASSFI